MKENSKEGIKQRNREDKGRDLKRHATH